MEQMRAMVSGLGSLSLNPVPRLNAYRVQMTQADKKQRQQWARMLSQEYRQAQRRNG